MLDNDCSNALTYFLVTEEAVAFQLTSAGMHRHNAAEQAIRMARITSLLVYARSTQNSPYTTFGINLSHRRSSPSTWYAACG